jgi:4-amino-4-deoxy-L-arabinose transferase-like glycosyltransferase
MKVRTWPSYSLLIALCGWFCFWHLGGVSFIDPDEGMYGSIARAMAESGDWITPRFDGVRYLNKPPLLFWLSALTFKTFGPSEWGVRLWSALPAFGTALLVALIARLTYGRPAGMFSAPIFASSVGTFVYAHMTLTDPLFILSLTLGMTAGVLALVADGTSTPRAGPPLLFYFALGFGALTKGAPAVLLPVGIFVILGVFNIAAAKILYRSLIANRYAALGIALGFAIVAPWHILAARANPGFAQYYFLDNQLRRFATGKSLIEDDVSVTTPMFLILALVWFLPWSLLLPAAFKAAWAKEDAPQAGRAALRRLPLIWAVVVLGFFSLSSSKLEHYSLPALPALALIVGGWWTERLAHPATRPFQWPALALLVFAALATALFHWGPTVSTADLFNFSTMMGYYRTIRSQGYAFPSGAAALTEIIVRAGLTLLLGIAAAAWLASFARVKSAFAALLIAAAGIYLLLFRLIVLLEPYHSSKPVADAVLQRAEAADLILHEDPLEYSGGLVYYTNRRVYIVNGRRGSLEFGARFPDVAELFLDSADLARLWGSDKRIFFVTRLPPEQSALRLVPHGAFVFLGEYGARRLYTNRE